MHARIAKTIYRLPWDTQDVLALTIRHSYKNMCETGKLLLLMYKIHNDMEADDILSF